MDIALSRPQLSDDRLRSLEVPEALEQVAGAATDAELFTLTFHAAFTVKIFEVMKREGPAIQGFERMQQSLRDSVEQVRASLSVLPDSIAAPFLEQNAEGQSALMRLIRDLARYKNWMLERAEAATPKTDL
jgi:hypothetical protein